MAEGLNIRIPEFRRWPEVEVPVAGPAALARFLRQYPRTLVLSGAGCSTASGIPAYRDGRGRWTRRAPIQYQAFMNSAATRQRYWARSYLGWPRMLEARPNPAHQALARLARAGFLHGLVTQNVDGLHQKAGSQEVIELHGSLSEVVCQDCGRRTSRARVQAGLSELNPGWQARVSGLNPDGDAELEDDSYHDFRPMPCSGCQGRIKPDVVFFGENVPAARVSRVRRRLAESQALLVVGSSLVVWSGYRFVREAHAMGLPVVAVNRGRTRADEWLRFRLDGGCDRDLSAVADTLLDCERSSPGAREW